MIDIRRFPLVSDQIDYAELTVIVRELERILTARVPGDVVEFGCYNGTTSLFIQRVLQAEDPRRTYHVYDSFTGLPDKSPEDTSPAGEQFVKGELTATKTQFIRNFKQAGLPLPTIHKGWFNELSAADIPQDIAFAFLDGDFFQSITASLRHITPHLSPGARVLVDDYQSEALPGARKAVDAWAHAHGLTVRAEQSLALITWP